MIPARLQQAVCTQDFKHEVGGAIALRYNINQETKYISLDAPAVTASRNITVLDQEELNYIIVRKLQEKGEHVYPMFTNERGLPLDQYLFVMINQFANKIAIETRRRPGNVIIASKKFVNLIEPLASTDAGYSKLYDVFEYDSLEPDTFIILARNPKSEIYRVNACGSPILLMDEMGAEASGFKDMKIGWAWEDLVTEYVKIVHYKLPD